MRNPAMAMSLSADDEDYDSDSEQVSTLRPPPLSFPPLLLLPRGGASDRDHRRNACAS